jgi:hypothetical protein
MKRVATLLLPLILFAAFLSFKPPAVTAVNKPATDQITTDAAPTTPVPKATKNVSPKPPVIQGGDDEDDDEDEDEEDDEGRDRKPSYGGHDDDDYDDD